VNSEYEENGYFVSRNLFADEELLALHATLLDFHKSWLIENDDFYQRQAINSAYVTGNKHLSGKKRQLLFEFIGSNKIASILASIIPSSSAFIGTQIFFDPSNPAQRNYWHRDIQYNNLSIEQQKTALSSMNALHFRVPLKTERGVELVPGTHQRWDSEEEFDTRTETNGKTASDDLSAGKSVPLGRGDLLVFSGNMIHRGLYGGDRFAFDILFGDATPDLAKYVDDDCLPNKGALATIQSPATFLNAINLKADCILT
jgi:ectoine hydroxylase-related dioxygenase (phytanoyl-CoA dioxygenase family)